MAYVPGFEWDIFISYPRESDERDSQDLEWVNEFHRILQKEIGERIPDNQGAKIFFDRREFGASDVESQILTAARNSALFLPILSPRFVAPGKFTLKELDAFCEAGDVGKRIVTIELLPVTQEDGRPASLHGTKRNNFFIREEGRPVKLAPKSKKYGDEYATRIQIVAEDIKAVLQEMRRDRAAVGASSAPAPREQGTAQFNGLTVWLGEKEEGVNGEWEQVRAFLQREGATLVPTGEYSFDDDELLTQAGRDLDAAGLCVQLLSPEDEAIHRDERPGRLSRARMQSDAAKRAEQRGVPLLQWRKPMSIRPEAFKYWDKTLLEGPSVLVGSIEDLKSAIRQKIIERKKEEERAKEKAAATVAAAAGKPKDAAARRNTLFINVAPDDRDIADELLSKAFGELEKKPGWIVKRCPFEGTPSTLQKALDENLMNCGALWFVYGHSDSSWLDRQLLRFEKVSPRRDQPLPPELKVILLVPPPRRRDIPWMGEKMIDWQDGISVERVRELIAELER